MSSDKRVERNSKSIVALRDYLRDIVKQPASVSDDRDLLIALKSQGNLSKYSNEIRGIQGSSLNTIKRISEYCLDGGFGALDLLRRAALEAIATSAIDASRSNKESKAGLTKRVQELETENQILHEDLLRLSSALITSLIQGRNYAAKSEKPSVLALCTREQRELRATLALMVNNPPSNVVSIKRD